MFTLPALPYSLDGLSPYLSHGQLELHYEKHHAGYVKKLNELTRGTPFQYDESPDRVIREVQGGEMYNMAAQHYNHSLYWESMSPHPGVPSIKLQYMIDHTFGNLKVFKDLFVKKAMAHFGSGWIWLVSAPFSILVTHDAHTPIEKRPLMVCDLWEHAYYIDYQNEKEKYFKAFVDKLVNWKNASDRFE